MDLAFIWAGLIAFAVLAYVILDGFDLGLGLLFPFLGSNEERDVAMNSVAPVWDGNETWLVLGGGGLFAVFPLAYAIVMPALYAPIIAMVLGLVFRGVAFEFRWRTTRARWVWDVSFFGGSLIATLAQGIALGALVQGIEMDLVAREYSGGNWDWLTPFSLLTGAALVVGYALLGATWLVMKAEGDLNARARRYAMPLLLGTLALIGAVSLWTPFLSDVYFTRWLAFVVQQPVSEVEGAELADVFAWWTVITVLVMPVLVAGAAFMLWRGLRTGHDTWPFVSALAIFVLCFVGIGISFYPMMVPPDLTIWMAAAPDDSLWFLLVGAMVLVPLILAYTGYAYWVFRGKVRAGEGYH